ncbi:hypothetical protein MTO96_007628 [Rhipicephalus appendiculatus]
MSVNSRTYEQIVEYLDEEYNRQVNETAASFSFFMRKQQDGESIRKYIADLRILANNCNISDSLNRMLRDRIVCGIRDDDALLCLLARKKLTVEEVEEFAMASGKALDDVRYTREGLPQTAVASTNVVQSQRGRRYWTQRGNNEASRYSYDRCGGPQATRTCRHRNARPYHCVIKGHLGKVCSRGRSQAAGAFAVEPREGESAEEMLLALIAHSSGDGATLKPCQEDFTWEGRKLRMIIDTGSPVNVIPMNIFKKHRKCTVGEKSSTTRSVCQLVKGFGVTSTVSPRERKVRRLCDEVAEEDARPTPLSVELVGVVRPVRPSVFRDWQLSSLFGKRGDCCHHATRGEQTVRDVVAEVIVRAGVRKWFHFPWTPDEKGAFKKVSSAAGVIGCVDGSVAVIIAPKGDHHKAASYCCKKHYADIVMLTWESCREPLRLGSADDACVWRTTRLRERFEGGHGLQRPYLLECLTDERAPKMELLSLLRSQWEALESFRDRLEAVVQRCEGMLLLLNQVGSSGHCKHLFCGS